MEINVSARDLDLNPEAESYIQKKFRRLERHLRTLSDAKLELSRTSARSQSDRVVAQLTLRAGGYTLRGQEGGPNLFAAVDAVTAVLDRQIRRHKGKFYRTSQAKKSARATAAREDDLAATEEPDAESEQEEALAELGKVVRTKRFLMKPMRVEDAILEMELLDHDFFLFHNVESGHHNVVYRRRDGDYGHIEPELP